MSALTAPGFYPFTIAALILVGLVVFEIMAALVGFSFTNLNGPGHGQGLPNGHGEHGGLDAWMSWLNRGGVPLLILIMIALATFAIAGFVIQSAAKSIAAPLPTFLASACAIAATVPVTRTLSRWAGKILPKDESAAISQAEFVGLTGSVALGPLDQGKPGRVRVKDRYGNIHVLRANAAPGHTIPQGASVLLVDGSNGHFTAIPAPQDLGAGIPVTVLKEVNVMDTASALIIAGTAIILFVGIGVVMASLYTRATRDKAYVRTGLGGKKVVLDGGAVILPIFHSYSWVQLSTLRLEVQRSEAESLITADRMRADIAAEFYVRVKPDEENIALAAQTLGDRTTDAELLKQLVEAKFVDGLRSVAATMTLKDLQEKRSEFVKAVQDAVAADLQSNGLELESVSLTRFDQTDIKHFNPNNTFDAEGLTALTRVTEERRRERNEIVRANEVAIAAKDREAALQRLTIQREQRDAELSQQRDIANKTAETRAEQARAEQTARLAEETARLETERGVAKNAAEAHQAKETARISAERGIAESEAEAKRISETARIDAAIAVAQKSEAESQAKAKAEEARAAAVKAEEQVATARSVEIAERAKKIAVIDARKEAEQAATAITVKAEAEREAAQNLATAMLTQAEGEANANKVRAGGIIELGEAEAKRERALNEARNALSPQMVDFELTKQRIAVIPEALEQAMKPIEKISDIKIFSAGGLLGAMGNGASSDGAHGGGPIGDLSSQLLSYGAQKPILDAILSQAGFTGSNPVDALLNGTQRATAPARTEAPKN